ncbi:MAG: creatininase family protein, partial [Acidimicrobiia bacterium]|nr:creatininase family protein [Acidimicrobiia bacterium]
MTGLGALAYPDLAAAAPAVLLVPVGSCEQHGPHLPLDTDTRIGVAVAREVVRRRPGLLLGPPFAYGASGEHAGFPGTVSLGTEALAQALVELGRSLGPEFAGLVLLSWHGGNAHAGYTETSLMLALQPELVRPERAVPGDTSPLAELMPRLREAGVRAVSPSGVLGDPTGASAGEGERLLATLA